MRDGPGFRPLPWDSEFFGLRIATATQPAYSAKTLAEMLAAAQGAGIACLYLLVQADDSETAHLAEAAGFRLVDVRITLSRSLTGHKLSGLLEPRIRAATEADLPVLAAIAAGDSFTSSRFYHDGHFSRERCQALYRTWIEKDVHSGSTLIAETGGTIVGFISCHVNSAACGQIGLVGLPPAWRGQGLGKVLIDAALACVQAQGAGRAEVVTQGRNVSALRVYEKCGFRVQSVELWFHKWFP